MFRSSRVRPICLPTTAEAPLLTADMSVQAFGFGVRNRVIKYYYNTINY